jgi:hypothetical protein
MKMSVNEKKRQERSMKKRRKERAKRKLLVTQSSLSTPKAIIRRAQKCPIFECLINPDWPSSGLATVIVARQQDSARVVFGSYLLDTYCLGLKNTFCNCNLPLSEYRNRLRAKTIERTGAAPCSPEYAHQVIYGAIDYAESLGFRPHRDFALSRFVLEERETIPPNAELKFGKDGKPFYISGPNDDYEAILDHLEKRVGRDDFHFIVGGPAGEDDLFLEEFE